MADTTNLESILLILKAFSQRLSNAINISQIYLFGSYAKGTANPDSDIDVLILSPDFSGDRLEDLVFLMKIRREFDLRIEPHPFRPDQFNESHPFIGR